MYKVNSTEKMESAQTMQSAWENRSLGLIEAVHQSYKKYVFITVFEKYWNFIPKQ